MSQFKLDEGDNIKSGFSTPNGYFEGFADRLSERLAIANEPKVVPLYRRRPVWLSAAAVFVILLGLGIFFKDMIVPKTVQPDAEAIESYLVYQQGINSYDLIQNLDVQDIKEIEVSLDDIPDDAIQDYLTTEDIYLE
ncbi:hypothetical protein AM493_02355 [Flavobacterium akiainvivens]|uniref:Uncharacterized protein n=1 Tax=Flavobacterium akiainvivens TaxID=1202724 RepID=A0A0M8MGC1_9FLAO|nr:hypothetical protein [Flavobacterium akiainvivens]KOS05008.1 hypothetical protein AM493_02355 [Flavobacterium akiainvivens]SFQ40463.1 hypothetical protein SAMN05444144_10446 [Flavobacterium akiainvivens]